MKEFESSYDHLPRKEWKRLNQDKRLRALKGPLIAWAVDPFTDDDGLQEKTIRFLKASYPDSRIQPIYVLSEEVYQEHGVSNFLRPALKPLALKTLEAIVAEAQSENIARPRVLLEPTAHRASCARRFLRFTEKMDVDLIALSSHCRKGLTRFLVGSFSEEVLSATETPVLFTGPETKENSAAPEVVVFPTDFSPECAEAFEEVIEIAKRFDAELHLFHKTTHNLDPFVQSGVHVLGGGWVSLETFFAENRDSFENEAQAWVAAANAQGVKTSYFADLSEEPAAQAINDYVGGISYLHPVVALVSHNKPMSNLILGSVTKEVIRHSRVPVYIVH